MISVNIELNIIFVKIYIFLLFNSLYFVKLFSMVTNYWHLFEANNNY